MAENQNCEACGRSVGGTFVLAEGRPMHPECFKCHGCKVNLANQHFANYEGAPHCQKCISELARPVVERRPGSPSGGYLRKTVGVKVNVQSKKCCRCERTVYAAEEIQVGGKPWHKVCFKCTECKKALELGKESMRDDDCYCKGCYSRKFGPKGVGFGNSLSTETISS
eukprot:comp11280_c0_seq1/m.5696 comp11280_c0_seq1/g.5696  ORF comp11280_c0_seq1/g.5696 comp11280_c0_seq1/m.5696 type:complete len:168 (-) comp11280_c0_seq1:211-714(-)